jgi:DNA replication protein DnaC
MRGPIPSDHKSHYEDRISLSEAISQKMAFPDPPPTLTCEYCGKSLEPMGIAHPFKANTIWTWNHEPIRCDCGKALEYWAKVDEAELQRRRDEDEAMRKFNFKQKVDRLFKESKMGARSLDRTFDKFQKTAENAKAFQMAQRYAAKFDEQKEKGIGLLLSGTCGTGKTHLAAAISIELLNKGTPVIFGTMISLLGKLKETYERGSRDSEDDIIELYSTVDLLVIDDLGKERPGEWVLEKLYYILNSRYENKLPVIVTTNYSIGDLKDRLTVDKNYATAEAIISRLYEMTYGIDMTFADYRKGNLA